MAALLGLATVSFSCADEDAVTTGDASAEQSGIDGGPDGEVSTGDLAYFAPEPLPDDAVVMSARVNSGSTSSESHADGRTSAVVIGRPVDDGYSDVVRVMVSPAPEGEDPSSYEGVRRVDVNGLDAYQSDHPLTGSYVGWLDGSRAVVVLGAAGAADLTLEVAREVEVAEDGTVGLADVPEGYAEVASHNFDVEETLPNWMIAFDSGGDPPRLLLTISGSVVPTGAPLSLSVGGDRLGHVDVRGSEAVTSETLLRFEQFGVETVRRSVAWLERPGFVISISGSRSLDDLLEVARSLHEVDRETFEALAPESLQDVDWPAGVGGREGQPPSPPSTAAAASSTPTPSTSP